MIIIKFILKNIFEKKLRTFLILLSITLSSAVFFASMAISGSFLGIFANTLRTAYGNSDIKIYPSENSFSPYVSANRLEPYKNDFEYIIEELSGYGTYSPNARENINLYIKGIDYDDMQMMMPFILLEENNLKPFKGQKIIISKKMADAYNLKLGDPFIINSESGPFRSRIAGIAKNQGFFSLPQVYSVLMTKDSLESMLGTRNNSNILYIKLHNNDRKTIDRTINKLSELYNHYEVTETIPFEQLENDISGLSNIFFALSSIVFFMSIFIIYSAFKIITTERIPVIGTLRSIGAQKKTTNFILIGESLVYGVLGGITGCLIGIAILKVIMFIMLKLVSAGGLQVSSGIKYSPFHFLLTFLIALVMCLAGALVPIIIVSKISVKDIILNTISNVKKKKKTRLFLGLAFLLMAFVLAFVSSEENAGQFGMLTMIMTLVAVVILIPYITTIFTRILENLYVFFFGNIGILAAKNLRENKNILNNITMLAIGISSLLFINIIGYESVVEATNKYNNVKYALEMGISNNSRDVIKIISNVDGVEDVYGAYIFNNEQDTDGENSISRVFGVNRLKFTEFWDFESTANSKDVLEELDSGRNIILTNAQKSMLEVEVGDNVNIDINGKKCVYKVIGFNKTILNTSNTALVSERFLKSDMQLQSNMYSYFYIKANKDPVYVKESIEKDLNKKSPLVRTVNELKEEEIDSLKQIILLMQMFCFLAMFIGCFGVVNNLLIGFLQRKHSIAVFRSVGMSKNQTIKMIFIEALSGGIIGGSAGVIGGILMIFNMSLVGDSSTQAHYPLGSFIIYILVGSLVMTIASISPALKSSKIDLVSSLKYE